MVATKSSLSWITVTDLDRAKKLFSEHLGLSITQESPEFGWLEFAGKDGGAILGVAKASDEMPAGVNAIMTFDVDNIDEAKAFLEERNVTFHGEIIEIPGEIKMAFFSDEDGNKFQIVETLSN